MPDTYTFTTIFATRTEIKSETISRLRDEDDCSPSGFYGRLNGRSLDGEWLAAAGVQRGDRNCLCGRIYDSVLPPRSLSGDSGRVITRCRGRDEMMCASRSRCVRALSFDPMYIRSEVGHCSRSPPTSTAALARGHNNTWIRIISQPDKHCEYTLKCNFFFIRMWRVTDGVLFTLVERKKFKNAKTIFKFLKKMFCNHVTLQLKLHTVRLPLGYYRSVSVT